MKSFKRIIASLVLLLATLAMSQVVLFNLRLHATLQLQRIEAQCSSLESEIEELQNETATLLSPARLEAMGDSIGLAPVTLDRLAVIHGAAVPDDREESVAQL